MKPTGHPKYHTDAKVTCVCGNSWNTGSTKPEIHLEICSKCHPFFTGQMKFVDTQGKVERFQALQEKAKLRQKEVVKKKEQEVRRSSSPMSLREMLAQSKK